MKTKRINGLQFEELLKSGLNNLKLHEQELNDLNVFPVPDGDTGTNMRLTLSHGLQHARSTTEIGAYLKMLSDGMLLGARGNSGVILSQIFRGIFLELSRAGSVSAADLRNGFIRGYRTAYAAVARPVEGTILTVAREGIESIRTQIGRSTCIEDMMGMFLAEMRKSLAHTPDMLPVLKEAGVVDSGASGFIIIVDGMLQALYGEAVEAGDVITLTPETPEQEKAGQPVRFDANSKFEDGYCVEFILQLMNGADYRKDFRTDTFTKALEEIGNSTVVVQNDDIVKVHVHTMKPSRAFRLAERYGEFLSIKVDNMQIQHNEHVHQMEAPEKTVVKKAFTIVAVANSKETAELFRGMGADEIADGGQTMNTSAEAFIEAFKYLDSETIVVLPNNKNIIPAATQAANLTKGKTVVVLPSESIAEGYFALAMDVPVSEDREYRISSMKAGIERASTLSLTTATKSYETSKVKVEKGDQVAILNGKVVSSEKDFEAALSKGFAAVEDLEDKEACVVFTGENALANAKAAFGEELTEEDLEEKLTEWIQTAQPMLEVQFLKTNQPVYDWIIGLI